MWKTNNCLMLDMDGVLADFDKAAHRVCGMDATRFENEFGIDVFWERINSDKNFFRNLDFMPDAMDLYNSVKHLEPIILTGIPRDMNPKDNQKIEWAKEKFGPRQKIICCPASKKSLYCYEKGDILVDDRQRYMKKWQNKGGYFILHKSATKSIQSLKYLGVI